MTCFLIEIPLKFLNTCSRMFDKLQNIIFCWFKLDSTSFQLRHTEHLHFFLKWNSAFWTLVWTHKSYHNMIYLSNLIQKIHWMYSLNNTLLSSTSNTFNKYITKSTILEKLKSPYFKEMFDSLLGLGWGITSHQKFCFLVWLFRRWKVMDLKEIAYDKR